MNFFRRLFGRKQDTAGFHSAGEALAHRDPETGKYTSPVTYTDGNALIWIALTPEAAREVRKAAKYHGQEEIAGLVTPYCMSGGKLQITVAQRAMMRRLVGDGKVV